MAGADGGERAAGAGQAWVPGGGARNSSAFSRAWIYSQGDRDGPTGQCRGLGHVCSQETSWCLAGGRAGSVPGWTDLPPLPQPHVPGIHLSSPAETSGRRGVWQRVNGGTVGAAGRVQPRRARGSAGIPSCRVPQEGHPRAGGTRGLLRCLMGRQLLTGHCLCSPPPDGDLPTGARTSRSCPRTPGRWHRVSAAVSRLSSPSRPGLAFRHLLPSRPEAKRAAGRAGVRDVAALPTCPQAGKARQMPRKHHPTPRTPCTHTHQFQLLGSGWA